MHILELLHLHDVGLEPKHPEPIMCVHVLRLRAEVQDEWDAVIIGRCVAGDDCMQLDIMQHVHRDVGRRLPAGRCVKVALVQVQN